jgi:hypothetical protein
MASTEIQSERIIKACDEYLKKTVSEIKEDQEYCQENKLQKREFLSDSGKKDFSYVKRLKMLAEESLHEREWLMKRMWPEGYKKDDYFPIMVNLNLYDHQLIGEYLPKHDNPHKIEA